MHALKQWSMPQTTCTIIIVTMHSLLPVSWDSIGGSAILTTVYVHIHVSMCCDFTCESIAVLYDKNIPYLSKPFQYCK